MALIDPFSSVQRVYTRQLTCGKGQRGRRAPLTILRLHSIRL